MATRTAKSIFYHIPKTGGTWVRVALKEAGVSTRAVRTMGGPHPFNLKWTHATPDTVVQSAPIGRFSYCFVRQPVAWYISYWSFRSRKGARRDEKFPADGLWSDDFDCFVNNILDAYPQGFVTKLYQYYTGEDGRKVDFVGTQENLVDDLVKALRLAGEEFDEAALRNAPRANESPDRWKQTADDMLTASTLLRILEKERWVDRFYE